MGSDRQALTLLHLSDPQFGPQQREAQGGTKADRRHDGLQERLLQDLEEITRNGGAPRPELVVVTGDLSEHAKPSQLAAFEAFADVLLTRLGLARERLVIIPGNHDVSWSACESYFHGCAAQEIAPEPPHWPKWKPFAELFDRWYGGSGSAHFTEERPYSLFVHEELRTVVAGLNSTMPETHQPGQHFGEVGEDQLRWFRDQLEPFKSKGWLRIAALHHNVIRNPSDDDANLKDAYALEMLLGEEINLVLHGHTHDGKLQTLRPELPVLSTGSAAVVAAAPGEAVRRSTPPEAHQAADDCGDAELARRAHASAPAAGHRARRRVAAARARRGQDALARRARPGLPGQATRGPSTARAPWSLIVRPCCRGCGSSPGWGSCSSRRAR